VCILKSDEETQMLIEKAVIEIRPGSEETFHQSIAEHGVPLLAAVPGVKWVKFGRGVENPGKFLFLVEWDSMAAHAAFNESAVHSDFVALFAPHGIGGAMEHFEVD
jgi:heme-degrading monooxygenase HmoA